MRTVKTLIRRLMAKKAVDFRVDERDSRIYHYRALVSKEDIVGSKGSNFMGLVYGNDPLEMLTGFVTDAKLSKAEIEKLEAILKAKKAEADAI